MTITGRILIADDEESFSRSTADLLSREGYECDISPDAETAIRMLKTSRYDLLIADIHMPGNSELELVKELTKIAEGMPVILVTGLPSISTAIKSISLPVSAYLVKPIEPNELLEQVKNSIEHFHTYRTISDARKRLQEWSKDLGIMKNAISETSRTKSSMPINAFFETTLRNVFNSMLDLKHLTEGITKQNDEQYVCNLFECSRLTALESGLLETIKVLEKSKISFKSKDLGELRKKLEILVGKVTV